MNKRDTDILATLRPKIEQHFADKGTQTMLIGRGEGRAMAAAIEELEKAQAKKPTLPGMK